VNVQAYQSFESGILKTKDGYIQGYNAQAAVDGAHQIIVARTLTNSFSDQAQLPPLLDRGAWRATSRPGGRNTAPGRPRQARLPRPAR
jgi:hypothetical protein